MINIARIDGEVQFTSTNIRKCYATLASDLSSLVRNCNTHSRHRRKPKRLIEGDNDDNKHHENHEREDPTTY